MSQNNNDSNKKIINKMEKLNIFTVKTEKPNNLQELQKMSAIPNINKYKSNTKPTYPFYREDNDGDTPHKWFLSAQFD